MRSVVVALLLLVACGCASSPELVVTVKTDFAPETELATVVTVLHDAASQTASRRASSSDAFLDGVRVASFPTTNGTASLTVELLDPLGGVLMSRDVNVDVHGSTAVTVLLTRSCANVHCPTASDPGDATSCEAGHCVSPTCTSGCTAATCNMPADCTVLSACVAARCDHGTCLYTPTTTTGCDGGVDAGAGPTFCPDAATLRQQLAVFLVRLVHGAAFVPAAATGVFADVPIGSTFAPFVEQLARDGITSGCGMGTFCPTAPVPRWAAAVFLVRAMHGATYAPPAATGTFADVARSEVYAPFVEQLARDGIAAGCGGGNFCPDAPLARRQAAVYVLKESHGATYTPPAATGAFIDVPTSQPEAPWIERFVNEGYAVGCER